MALKNIVTKDNTVLLYYALSLIIICKVTVTKKVDCIKKIGNLGPFTKYRGKFRTFVQNLQKLGPVGGL